MLQCVGEAADGRTWRPNGKCFTPQISMLMDTFLEVTNTEVVEVDIACCWSEPPQTVPQQKDEGTFANVISHLDNLAQCQRLGVQIPAGVGEFFNFKNYLCKLPIGNKFQLGKKLYCYLYIPQKMNFQPRQFAV